MCVKLANVSTQRNPNVKLLRQSSPWHVMTPHPTARLVTFTVFRRVAAPKRAPHPTEHSGESMQSRLRSSARWPPEARATSNMKRAFSRVYSLPEGGRPAHRIQHSTRERAFSRVYSLPESGRPEARAASNRALRRERFSRVWGSLRWGRMGYGGYGHRIRRTLAQPVCTCHALSGCSVRLFRCRALSQLCVLKSLARPPQMG